MDCPLMFLFDDDGDNQIEEIKSIGGAQIVSFSSLIYWNSLPICFLWRDKILSICINAINGFIPTSSTIFAQHKKGETEINWSEATVYAHPIIRKLVEIGVRLQTNNLLFNLLSSFTAVALDWNVLKWALPLLRTYFLEHLLSYPDDCIWQAILRLDYSPPWCTFPTNRLDTLLVF